MNRLLLSLRPLVPTSLPAALHPHVSPTHPSSQGSPAASSATRMSYSSAAYFSQSESSGPSLSLSYSRRGAGCARVRVCAGQGVRGAGCARPPLALGSRPSRAPAGPLTLSKDACSLCS